MKENEKYERGSIKSLKGREYQEKGGSESEGKPGWMRVRGEGAGVNEVRGRRKGNKEERD